VVCRYLRPTQGGVLTVLGIKRKRYCQKSLTSSDREKTGGRGNLPHDGCQTGARGRPASLACRWTYARCLPAALPFALLRPIMVITSNNATLLFRIPAARIEGVVSLWALRLMLVASMQRK